MGASGPSDAISCEALLSRIDAEAPQAASGRILDRMATHPPTGGEEAAVGAPGVLNVDLFGHRLGTKPPRPRSPKPRKIQPHPAQPSGDNSRVEGSSAPVAAQLAAFREEITSFKALDAEVCIACDAGEIWLVPEYTGHKERKELSLRDAATIAVISAAFPGATVTAFESRKEKSK